MKAKTIAELNDLPLIELESYCIIHNVGISVKNGEIWAIFVNRW